MSTTIHFTTILLTSYMIMYRIKKKLLYIYIYIWSKTFFILINNR